MFNKCLLLINGKQDLDFSSLFHQCTSIGSGRSPRRGRSLQYSCLENSMERGAWWATVQGVTKSQTRLTYRYTDMRDMHTHTVCKQCAYTDTRTHNKTNREHLGRAHKQGQKFCLNILHPFETISIMNLDTYVQI